MTATHDYDMHGHQPGCRACAAELEAQNRRTRADAKVRNTISTERDSTVTVTIAIKTGNGVATKTTETLKVAAGVELDPMSIAITAQRLGYQALRQHKG